MFFMWILLIVFFFWLQNTNQSGPSSYSMAVSAQNHEWMMWKNSVFFTFINKCYGKKHDDASISSVYRLTRSSSQSENRKKRNEPLYALHMENDKENVRSFIFIVLFDFIHICMFMRGLHQQFPYLMHASENEIIFSS